MSRQEQRNRGGSPRQTRPPAPAPAARDVNLGSTPSGKQQGEAELQRKLFCTVNRCVGPFFTLLFNLFNLSLPCLKFIKATGHEALLQRGVDEGKADAPILFGLYVNPTTTRAIHCRTGNCSHPTSLEPSTPISAAPTFRMNGFRSHVVLKSCGTGIRPLLPLGRGGVG